jgi:hypothetical protein
MADGFSFKFSGLDQLRHEFKAIDKRADRGAMWAIREAGRRVKREAKREAPVYHGEPDGDIDPRVIKGAYKKSIRSSKNLKRHGVGDYSLKVGPRGEKVHLYAEKVEEQYHPMTKGYERVLPQIRAIHERAWSRAIHKK